MGKPVPYTKDELARVHQAVDDCAEAEELFWIDDLERWAREKKDKGDGK